MNIYLFVVDEENFNVLFMNNRAKELVEINEIDNKVLNIREFIECENNDCDDIIEIIKTNEKSENIDLNLKISQSGDMSAILSSEKISFQNNSAILIGLLDVTTLKKAEEALKNIALIDELTGLYNRHFLDRRLNEEMDQADRYGEKFSIAILDIDHFKNVNDTWGQPIGDEILKQTAKIASNLIRKSDSLFRLGGKEFLILMPKTTCDEAVAIVERIRKTIENKKHPTVGSVTASFGVTERVKYESYISRSSIV